MRAVWRRAGPPSPPLQSRTAVVVLAGHFDVALVAVVHAPAVLDEPVVLAVFSAVTDGQHSVVKVVGGVAAGLVVVHTLGVEAKALWKGWRGEGG